MGRDEGPAKRDGVPSNHTRVSSGVGIITYCECGAVVVVEGATIAEMRREL